MDEDRIRVTRQIIYEGPRSWVEQTVARSLQGVKLMGPKDGWIHGITLGPPQIVPAPNQAVLATFKEPKTDETLDKAPDA